MSRRVALSSAFALALWSVTAAAQAPTPGPPGEGPASPEPGSAPSSLFQGAVAIVGLEIRGEAPPELKPLLETSIAKGLEAAGLQLIDRAQVAVAVAEEPDLLDCVSTTCLARIGELTGARHFLRASVEAVGAAYTLRLDLISPGDSGNKERRVEDACPVCTLAEVSELLTQASSRLVTTRQLPVPVLIATRPQGADLRIDDQPVGTAPFQGNLAPGPHQVSALFPGHVESRQTIEVAGAGEPQRFEVILTKAPPPITTTGPRPFRTWKWVTGGSGAAALIIGVALLAIDGNGTCSGSNRECPERYETLAAGIVGIGLGIGLGGASGWMFLRDRADSRPVSVGRKTMAVTPVRGGALGSLSIRF